MFNKRAFALVLAVSALGGCSSGAPSPPAIADESAAVRVQEFLTTNLPARPWSLAGAAIFDVEQYRVRGRFHLDVSETGDVRLEFSGSTLMGGHREDVAIALSADTLRIFDRERARFYEGAEVERMVREGTGVDGAWTPVLSALVGEGPDGAGLRASVGAERVDASGPGGDIRLEAKDGRLASARWPDPVRGGTYSDRLEIDYTWEGARLAEIRLQLPERGWRVQLVGDDK